MRNDTVPVITSQMFPENSDALKLTEYVEKVSNWKFIHFFFRDFTEETLLRVFLGSSWKNRCQIFRNFRKSHVMYHLVINYIL